MTRKISETLTAARAIIADPAKWTQQTHARDASVEAVRIDSKSAICFCLDGALALAAGVTVDDAGAWSDSDHYDKSAILLRYVAAELTGAYSYVRINDGDGLFIENMLPHEGTLALLDRGIDVAKSREELGMERVAP